MARLSFPLTPVLALSVAALSSTGHGNPMALDVHQEGFAELRGTWDGSLASWTEDARELVGGVGHRVAVALDQLRAIANLPAPDVTVLEVEPVTNASTSGFGWREDPITHRRKFHSGADIRSGYGTPVAAAGAGTVSFAGRQGGYGNMIAVDHGGGIVTRYAHLRRIETAKGKLVTAGERIGQVGSTGRTTGPHLHFEVRLDGHPVDPVTAMTVADLERRSPAAGHLAAQLLTPAIQSAKLSDVDPPKSRTRGPRPERRNRPRRAPKPLS